ncbi:MAG: hypothetical protein QXV97_03870 [Candidatus Caldarchaeum sp.]
MPNMGLKKLAVPRYRTFVPLNFRSGQMTHPCRRPSLLTVSNDCRLRRGRSGKTIVNGTVEKRFKTLVKALFSSLNLSCKTRQPILSDVSATVLSDVRQKTWNPAVWQTQPA